MYPLETSKEWFKYKYVVVDEQVGKIIKWEAGLDRIADLRQTSPLKRAGTSREDQLQKGAASCTIFNLEGQSHKLREINLEDKWETFQVVFKVRYPGTIKESYGSTEKSDCLLLNDEGFKSLEMIEKKSE